MTRDYDREWTDDVVFGETRIRYGLTTEDGVPVEFLVQLEYRVSTDCDGREWPADSWLAVARFDHARDGPPYRDVEAVGLHLDVLTPDGEQVAKRRGFPRVAVTQAIRYADGYLRDNHDLLIRRFERWL